MRHEQPVSGPRQRSCLRSELRTLVVIPGVYDSSVSLRIVADNPLTDPQLPRKVMDVVDRVAGTVRRRTTLPIITIVRGIVFGTMIAVVALALVVVVLIALARGAHELLDIWLDRSTAVWVSYLVIALVLFLLGGVLMRKRRSVSPDTP